MFLRHLSFTEQRRCRLSRKPGLERLELKNTITEPISVTSLAVTCAAGGRSAWVHSSQPGQQCAQRPGAARRRGEASRTPGERPDRRQPRPAQANPRHRSAPRHRAGGGSSAGRVGNGQERRQTRVERLADPEHDPGGECLRCSWHLVPLAAGQAPGRRCRPAAARRFERVGPGPTINPGGDHSPEAARFHARRE